MPNGTVKWFNDEKGFGFIQPADQGNDVFVHATGLAQEGTQLNEGDQVEFDLEQGRKGPQAANVRVLASA